MRRRLMKDYLKNPAIVYMPIISRQADCLFPAGHLSKFSRARLDSEKMLDTDAESD
jgi:hypothetical protein